MSELVHYNNETLILTTFNPQFAKASVCLSGSLSSPAPAECEVHASNAKYRSASCTTALCRFPIKDKWCIIQSLKCVSVMHYAHSVKHLIIRADGIRTVSQKPDPYIRCFVTELRVYDAAGK